MAIENNLKIAIIGVYFGQLPEYFHLWKKSCECNKDIDFFLFTDQVISCPSENIKVINYSLRKMKERADEVLEIDCALTTPYKCCDFKPVYGLLFSEYLKEYDYWGHCDLDMIFGDLQCFLKKYSLEKYDKFLPLGHLSLYKNVECINNSFMNEGSYVNYQEVFSSDDSYGFDEMDGMAAIYYKNGYSFFDKKIFADIDQKHLRFRLSEYCVPKGEKINFKYQIFYWEDGHIFRIAYKKNKQYKEEFSYIHFQKRKNMRMNDVDLETNSFFITNEGFFSKKEKITKKTIIQYNLPKSILREYIEEKVFNIKVLKKKIKRFIFKYLKRCKNK